MTDSALAQPRSGRLYSIDALRGLAMILMALDHVRDFFGDGSNPHDMSVETPWLFLTRWVTHFCAPIFVLLAGTAAWIYGSKGRSKRSVSRFLLTRGLWLVLLELTVVNFGWLHSFGIFFWQVIAVIGLAMVALAGLVYLPQRLILAVGIAIVCAHNLLDSLTPADFEGTGIWWVFLHEGAMVNFRLETIAGYPVLVIYPLLPWIGVIAVGYGIGPLMKRGAMQRRRTCALLGAGLVLAFVVVRALNGYGNPAPWATQGSATMTVMSFLNCAKYPPSLAYLLMTLGPAFLLLAILDRSPSKLSRTFIIFGRVPLFYYLVHLHVIHLASRAFYWAQYGEPISRVSSQFSFLPRINPEFTAFSPLPADFEGQGLLGVYFAWIAIVVALYPLCAWFARVKQRSRSAWLSYL